MMETGKRHREKNRHTKSRKKQRPRQRQKETNTERQKKMVCSGDTGPDPSLTFPNFRKQVISSSEVECDLWLCSNERIPQGQVIHFHQNTLYSSVSVHNLFVQPLITLAGYSIVLLFQAWGHMIPPQCFSQKTMGRDSDDSHLLENGK